MHTATPQTDATQAIEAERQIIGAGLGGLFHESSDEECIADAKRRAILATCRQLLKEDLLQSSENELLSRLEFDRNAEDNIGLVVGRLGDSPELREEMVACIEAARGKSYDRIGEACQRAEGAARRRELKERLETALTQVCRPSVTHSEIVDPITAEPFSRQSLILTAAELRRGAPELREPIIDGYLREAETANLVAATKAGKTWLTHDLALSAATGRDWLGIPTQHGRVLIVDNELHAETLWHRLKTVSEARGIKPAEFDQNLWLWPMRGKWKDLEYIGQALSYLKSKRFRLVILDALYRLLPEKTSENDNAAICRVYNTIDRAAQSSGAAIVVVHHASKGGQAEKGITDVGSGAGSQSRAVDAHIVLRPHAEDGCAVMEAAVRSFAPPEPLALRWTFPVWNPAPNLDPRSLKRPDTRQQRLQQDRDLDGIKAIKALMVEAGEPVTAGKIRNELGTNPDRVGRLLKMLMDAGEIVINRTVQLSKDRTATFYALSG